MAKRWTRCSKCHSLMLSVCNTCKAAAEWKAGLADRLAKYQADGERLSAATPGQKEMVDQDVDFNRYIFEARAEKPRTSFSAEEIGAVMLEGEE